MNDPAGSKNIERNRNRDIEKARTFSISSKFLHP